MIKIKSPCSTHSCRNRGFFHFNAASFRRMKKRTSYFNNILNRYLYPAFSENLAEVQRIIEKLSGTHHGKEIRLKTSDSLAKNPIFFLNSLTFIQLFEFSRIAKNTSINWTTQTKMYSLLGGENIQNGCAERRTQVHSKEKIVYEDTKSTTRYVGDCYSNGLERVRETQEKGALRLWKQEQGKVDPLGQYESKTSYMQVLSVIWCGWFDPKYF